MSVDRYSFDLNGFLIIKDFWPPEVLNLFERAVERCYGLQMHKIDAPRLTHADGMSVYVRLLEDMDKEAAHQASRMVEMTPAAKFLSSMPALLHVAEDLIRCPQQFLMISGPQPLVNSPNTDRLLYNWHAETAYYPKRRNFLNVWFPIFTDKTEANGTMYVLEGSHLVENRPFIEYTEGKNCFVQYEIPPSELTEYKEVAIEAKRGDLVVFHKNMVHRSSRNHSNHPSYAGIMRILDYREDLTLSADPSAIPYSTRGGTDYGRPGIDVNRA